MAGSGQIKPVAQQYQPGRARTRMMGGEFDFRSVQQSCVTYRSRPAMITARTMPDTMPRRIGMKRIGLIKRLFTRYHHAWPLPHRRLCYVRLLVSACAKAESARTIPGFK